MAKIKEENVDILNWKYLKEKDKYIIAFKINNLEPQRRKRIIKRYKSGFLKRLGADIAEIREVGNDLFIKEYYEKEDIEIYDFLIQFAQNGVVPGRLDPEKTEIEDDLCRMEQDMKFRMDYAGRSVGELKRYCTRIKYLQELKK